MAIKTPSALRGAARPAPAVGSAGAASAAEDEEKVVRPVPDAAIELLFACGCSRFGPPMNGESVGRPALAVVAVVVVVAVVMVVVLVPSTTACITGVAEDCSEDAAEAGGAGGEKVSTMADEHGTSTITSAMIFSTPRTACAVVDDAAAAAAAAVVAGVATKVCVATISLA
jgi:hypothetical protein